MKPVARSMRVRRASIGASSMTKCLLRVSPWLAVRNSSSSFPTALRVFPIRRGNWGRNEAVALAGDYRPLLSMLGELQVGGYFFLEACTPRAGDLEFLAQLPSDRRIGVGVVNQKLDAVETTVESSESA